MAGGKRLARRLGAWICFADEAGFTLKPAKATTWAPRGNTPSLVVGVKSSKRLSIAGLACYHHQHPPRMIYRIRRHHGSTGEPKGFKEPDFAAILDTVHQQLGAPIIVIWDGLPQHVSTRMHDLIATRAWLHTYQLPSHSPHLNPSENIWSNLRRGLANLTPGTLDQLYTTIRKRLKDIQKRTPLLHGFLKSTHLTPLRP